MQLLIKYKARSSEVYLPYGATWKHFSNGKIYEGGQNIICDAPLSEISVFIKNSQTIIN